MFFISIGVFLHFTRTWCHMGKVPGEERTKMGGVIPFMACNTLWGELDKRHCDWIQYLIKMQFSAPENYIVGKHTNVSMWLFSFFIFFTGIRIENHGFNFFSEQISKCLNYFSPIYKPHLIIGCIFVYKSEKASLMPRCYLRKVRHIYFLL